MTLVLWSAEPRARSVPDVPKIRDEDKQFAVRLGHVLRELRFRSPWTQEQAAEELGFNAGTYGRWERGDYAPKGYDLGRLYRGYEPFGAKWEWFFDPPEVVVLDPVRESLSGHPIQQLVAHAQELVNEAEAEQSQHRSNSSQQPQKLYPGRRGGGRRSKRQPDAPRG
jgi:transcriptional regulator with XRE-family HTH domain